MESHTYLNDDGDHAFEEKCYVNAIREFDDKLWLAEVGHCDYVECVQTGDGVSELKATTGVAWDFIGSRSSEEMLTKLQRPSRLFESRATEWSIEEIAHRSFD